MLLSRYAAEAAEEKTRNCCRENHGLGKPGLCGTRNRPACARNHAVSMEPFTSGTSWHHQCIYDCLLSDDREGGE